MQRRAPRLPLFASLALAGIGLALFFGDVEAFGLPLGFIGVWLVVAGGWGFVADRSHPGGDAGLAIAPGESRAWLGLAFSSALLAVLLANAAAFAPHVPIGRNPRAVEVGHQLASLLLAWILLAAVVRQRWRGRVLADERDLQIAHNASHWGRGAIVVGVVAVAVLLGFSPTARVQHYSNAWIAQLLMGALLAGSWLDNAIAAGLYWRDRRAAA